MSIAGHILHAISEILKTPKTRLLFATLWCLFFALMYLIPVQAIPGNDIVFQATVYGWDDYLQLGLLSLLSAAVLTMQVAIVRQRRSALNTGAGAVGGVGVLSGIFSSMFASASCALCLGGLFGFIGANTLVLLVDNKALIFSGGIALLLISLYLSSKRLSGICETCHVK